MNYEKWDGDPLTFPGGILSVFELLLENIDIFASNSSKTLLKNLRISMKNLKRFGERRIFSRIRDDRTGIYGYGRRYSDKEYYIPHHGHLNISGEARIREGKGTC